MINQAQDLNAQAVSMHQQMVDQSFQQLNSQLGDSSILRYAACNNWDEIVAVSQDTACLGKYTNLAGALAGVAASVAIELTREGGSVATASVAAGVGGGLIFANREAIMGFQNGPASVVGGLGLLGLTQVAARIVGAVAPNKSEEVQEYIG
ncbi:hypothetical protein PQC65_gp104 [Aeromonas phage pAEv1810]|uniref:hypothetical protein n=1 Tax=Aeromonas phage pAEv1810 TaxID=2908744 RepID=UPI00232939A4|nr:hypothetical protein PQC65_gp104 [Aeromonas phage pAEv1810]UIS25042.1 hypothetical protein pAEv1810_104 [Aeromonas phage pAEv1810]